MDHSSCFLCRFLFSIAVDVVIAIALPHCAELVSDPMKQLISAISLFLSISFSTSIAAQNQVEHPSLLGSWEGPLVLGRDNMNLAFTFAMREGEYTAALVSGGMGIFGMPADFVKVDGLDVLIRIPRLDLEFSGTFRLDAAGENIVRIDGDWFQRSEMVPVVLMPVDAPSY